MKLGDVVIISYCSHETKTLHAQAVEAFDAYQYAKHARLQWTGAAPEKPEGEPARVNLPAIVVGLYDDADKLDLQVMPRGGSPFYVEGVEYPEWRPRDVDEPKA